MELEMFLDGKFIDAVTINESDLKRLDKLQQKMERKHCHQLEYSDGQPQFFIRWSLRRKRKVKAQ